MRLTLGILFSLIIAAKPPRKNPRGTGPYKESDGLNNVDIFIRFIQLMYPTMEPPALRGSLPSQVSKFGSCTANLPSFCDLDRQPVINAFNEEVTNCADSLVSRIEQFVDQCIDKTEQLSLCQRLLTILDKDGSVDKNYLFRAGENLQPMTRNELISSKSLVIENLLIGVLHYLINNGRKNTVGSETYDELFKVRGEKKSTRYFADICMTCDLRSILRISDSPSEKANFTVSHADQVYEQTQAEVIDEESCDSLPLDGVVVNGTLVQGDVNNCYFDFRQYGVQNGR